MRNGNTQFLLIILLSFFLFILPMRNGNKLDGLNSVEGRKLFILPMRNGEGSKGMEDEVKNVNGKIKM